MALKRYTVDANDSIITAISLVDEPAVESNFIALSKQPQRYVHFDKEEKHMLYGCALRPDFDIYRVDEWTGEEYFLNFSTKSIEKLSRNFLKEYYQNSWTVDHAQYVQGLTVAESWIKTDMEKDKSVALGLDADLPVGTWFVGCYVDSNDIWEQVKEGKWKGFSIESWVSLDEIPELAEMRKQKQEEMNKDNNNSNDSLLDSIKSIILEALGKKEEEKKEEIDFSAEEKPAQLEEEKSSGDTETTTEEKSSGDTVPTEEIVEEVVDTVETTEETVEEQAEDLQAIIDGLQEEVDALKAENEELKKANQKMSKQPSAEQVKVDASKQTSENSWLDFASCRVRR